MCVYATGVPSHLHAYNSNMSRQPDDLFEMPNEPSLAAVSDDDDSTPRPMPRKKLPGPIETELKLLRHAFQEQGKELGALGQSVANLGAQMSNHVVRAAATDARFEALELRFEALELRVSSIGTKLDSILGALQTLISK